MAFDVNAPATLKWMRKEVAHERHLASVRDAARIAMQELTRTEFFSAFLITAEDMFSGDQIAQIFLTGGLARKGYARF